MPRPNRQAEKRAELMPIVAQTFSELGYRKTTTSELAKRCGVQENILYRLWSDKKAMFVESIEYLFDATMEVWEELLTRDDPHTTPAQRILAYDAEHRGEAGFYKITFAALSETEDAAVTEALAGMYTRFVRFMTELIQDHRKSLPSSKADIDPMMATWAMIGLAHIADITRITGLQSPEERQQLLKKVGRLLIDGHTPF